MRLKGADALIKKLHKNANLNDVKNVVKLNGSEMQSGAQRNSPVDTGTLKRSINYRSEDNGFTAKVAATVDYASYVEWGTRYMYAQPYMKPSFLKQRQQFLKDMKRLMK